MKVILMLVNQKILMRIFRMIVKNVIYQLTIVNRKMPMKSNFNDSQSKDTNENIPNDGQNFNIPTFDEEHEKNLEANEYINETLDYRALNIYDPAQ